MGKMKIAPAVKPNHESKREEKKSDAMPAMPPDGGMTSGRGFCLVRTCVCVGSVQQRVLGLVAQLHLLLQGLL